MSQTKDDESTSQRATHSILPKACENCRVRKIRCNKADPCSNCLTSGIECRPPLKTTESRPRVLLSVNYEKQVELIQDRLASIEKSLKGLALGRDGAFQSQHESPVTGTVSTEHGQAIISPSTFEGDSSFTNQTVRASQVAELTTSNQSSAEITDALSSLRTFIEAHPSATVSHGYRFKTDRPSSMPQMRLLPVDFVIAMIRKMKVYPPVLFLACAIRDHAYLEKIAQRIYFPTDPISLGTLTTMHGLLYFVIKEYIGRKDPILEQYDCENFVQLCEENFHTGIETYELLTEPSLDNLRALMLGIVKAQEEFKPTLCWALVSAAARHCQSLGLHRKSSMLKDTMAQIDEKRYIFWLIYTFDKNLSLNLGRASNIQDYDVDVDYFSISSDPATAPWDAAALSFLQLARLQGQVYERVYSLSALRQSPEQRAATISDLSTQLETWHVEWAELLATVQTRLAKGTASKPTIHHPEYFEATFGPTDVIYYSILTTLYRAASTSNSAKEISSACFDAARRSLESHLHHFPKFHTTGDQETISGYVSWILLYCSFTPLIIVFLHAIASSNSSDVALLESVTHSLEQIRSVARECERLSNIAKLLCRVAKAFIEQDRNHNTTHARREPHRPPGGERTAKRVKNTGTFIPGSYYNQSDDTLVLPSSSMPTYPAPTRTPTSFQQYAGAEYMAPAAQNSADPLAFNALNAPSTADTYDFSMGQTAGFSSSELDGMSTFFGNWLGGNQPVMDFMNMDFSDVAGSSLQ